MRLAQLKVAMSVILKTVPIQGVQVRAKCEGNRSRGFGRPHCGDEGELGAWDFSVPVVISRSNGTGKSKASGCFIGSYLSYILLPRLLPTQAKMNTATQGSRLRGLVAPRVIDSIK